MKKLSGAILFLSASAMLPMYAAAQVPMAWSPLCPHGSSLQGGCLPNCQGQQAFACAAALQITSVEDYLGIKVSNPTGMYVKSLSPTSSSNVAGPTITAGSNAVSCALFTSNGSLISPTTGMAAHTSGGGAQMMVATPPVTTPSTLNNIPPVIVAAGQSSTYSQYNMYQTGGISPNNTYYMICMGYTGSGSSVTNASASGLTVTW